jgi:hypothetical protein
MHFVETAAIIRRLNHEGGWLVGVGCVVLGCGGAHDFYTNIKWRGTKRKK